MTFDLHNPACRITRARQLRCMRRMRREGRLALSGYTPPIAVDVQATWRKYGWTPAGTTLVVHLERMAA